MFIKILRRLAEVNPNPWVMAIRPKTLWASSAPVFLGLALASRVGEINFFIAFLTISCALILQICSNLINDYYDSISGVDSEIRLGPPRVTQLGLLKAQQVKKVSIVLLIVAFCLGLILSYFGGIPIFVIGVSSLFFAWAYTGGPIPLSHYALGEFLAFVFFGPVAVWGTWFLQTHQWNWNPVGYGCLPGFLSAAIMAVNNARDRQTDFKSKKVTLATLLPEPFAKGLVVIFVVLAVISVLIFSMTIHWIILGLIPFFFYLKSLKVLVTAPSQAYNRLLAQTGQLLFVSCLIISIALTYSP